jgi:hypothetical protein
MKFYVMDHTGHSTVEFTEAQRGEAQAKFDELLAEGKIAGTRKQGASDYQKVKSFDELQDETTFTPPRVGG